jgi:hypothetical protein
MRGVRAGGPRRAHHLGMAGWGAVLASVLALACARTRAGDPPPTGPPAVAGEEPPPRGTPPPRTGELPPPPPARASEDEGERERRFPILEAQQRKERLQRAKQQASGHVEVQSTDVVHACDGLSAEERIECPLHDPSAVTAVTDVPRGVRVSLRAQDVVSPAKLKRMLDCHKGLAMARPQAPTACSFLDARSGVQVITSADRIDVEITRPADVERLRQQTRASLAHRR